MRYIIKILTSALIILAVSEIGKRSSLFAAIIASLPLTSLLAMIWLYNDTKDTQKIIELSSNIFWAVLPSLVFFIVFPFFLKKGFKFGIAMILSIIITSFAYGLYVMIMKRFGVKL